MFVVHPSHGTPATCTRSALIGRPFSSPEATRPADPRPLSRQSDRPPDHRMPEPRGRDPSGSRPPGEFGCLIEASIRGRPLDWDVAVPVGDPDITLLPLSTNGPLPLEESPPQRHLSKRPARFRVSGAWPSTAFGRRHRSSGGRCRCRTSPPHRHAPGTIERPHADMHTRRVSHAPCAADVRALAPEGRGACPFWLDTHVSAPRPADTGAVRREPGPAYDPMPLRATGGSGAPARPTGVLHVQCPAGRSIAVHRHTADPPSA